LSSNIVAAQPQMRIEAVRTLTDLGIAGACKDAIRKVRDYS
jgi:hypothetical protein